jgi:hypothetical protein
MRASTAVSVAGGVGAIWCTGLVTMAGVLVLLAEHFGRDVGEIWYQLVVLLLAV